MSNRLRACLLATVFIASAWGRPAGQVVGQGQPGQQQPPIAGTGFIAGQVVDSAAGRPIPEAQVQIVARNTPGARGVAVPAIVADAQGRFFFRGLVPGTYSLLANQTGYAAVRQALIEVADNERVLDAVVRLTKLATVTGSLRDSAGDPVVGTEVLAFQRTFTSGRLVLQPLVRGVKSDDRGMYRIPGLPPGEYFVCACLRDPNPLDPQLLTTLASQPLNLMSVAARALHVGADVVSLDDTLRGYAPTFHPNSATVARAERVSLAPGEDKTAVDITVDLVRATRVSGRVVGAESPMQASSIRLVPLADADAGIQLTAMQPMLVQADGRFDFANVPPGQYRLIVTHRETSARGGGPSGLALNFTGGRAASPPPAPIAVAGPGVTPPPMLWANEVISVGEGGLSGLVVSLSPGMNVSGRVQFVGNAPQPTEQMLTRSSLTLLQLAATGGASVSASGPVTASGTFRIVGGAVPGKYNPSFTGVPGYSNLRSVTLAGADITDLPIEVGTRDLGELVLTFVDTPLASLTISVSVQQGRRADDDQVLVFPVDRKYWAEPSAGRRRIRFQQVSAKGSAAIADLPAGEYFVAIETGMAIADLQESHLDAVSRRAQRITINDGEKKTIEVRR